MCRIFLIIYVILSIPIYIITFIINVIKFFVDIGMAVIDENYFNELNEKYNPEISLPDKGEYTGVMFFVKEEHIEPY